MIEVINDEIKGAFLNWLRRLFESGKIGKTEKIEKINIGDGKTMIIETIEKMKVKYKNEGMQQGMQQGKQETAINMFKEGFDIELISRITGLPVEEIKKVIESN